MAEENVVRTNIVATSDMSGLIGDLNKVSLALSQLQERLNATNKGLAVQAAVMNKAFAETLRSTGQFSTHFVSLTSDVDKFGQQLDKGQIKLGQFFRVYGDHVKTSGGVIRELAKQQVQLQNAILQPLGRNAEGLMQYNVHIPRGLDLVKNKTAIARQELAIMNRVVQEGAGQLINWGKNTQWAGRQLTVGLTIPLAAFGKAAADAFRMADQELVRLTKVYGGLSATTSAELAKVRRDVSATASELARGYGASFKETISLAADIAATGKEGNELLGSVKETTRLAVLGEVDRQEAMKATLAIQTAFKQNTEELSDSINFLNAVENQTSTTLQDLVEAIPKAGPIIKGLGGSVQDLALYMTAMREGGIAAGEGANALKSALGALINPTKVATGLFAGFGIDLKGIVQKNAGDVTATILELQAALDKLDPLQKQQALEQLFGKFQFARMNALFSNLGKQGSQTLQVMDLMKASSQELASVASRELAQVTESASGKYRRALEGLKADLAGVGEQFLKINTALINIISNIVKFAGDLPGPIKAALSFFGMLTAVAGPLIMLTGVLGNFFGYIIKGVFHFKALFKGAEGWKLLTPEILAANKAGSMAEQVFYSDAKAAAILNQALQGLIASYQTLQTHSGSGGIPMPVLPVGGTGREVNPNSPYITKIDTRHFSHMNPVSMMTSAEKSQQSIFGVVPGPQTVNQRISNMPQVYMTEDMPRIQGITSVGKVSTGVIAGEAAKFHALTGALGMQTAPELKKLRTEIARTGLITDELAQSYEALLPKMNDITTNAANRTKQIVAELQENKINADQARARIIALNKEIETMMVSAAQQTAAGLGRNINVTQLPLLNQPAFDPRTGKSNMKELFREKRGTRQLLNNIAQVLGVRTYGAGYSIETTRPKKMNVGGDVFYNNGDQVPGPNVNVDMVPAMLTPGEFVIRRGIAQQDPEGMRALNAGRAMIVPFNMGGKVPGVQYRALGGGIVDMLRGLQVRRLSISGLRTSNSRSGRQAHEPNQLNFESMSRSRSRGGTLLPNLQEKGYLTSDELLSLSGMIGAHGVSRKFMSRIGSRQLQGSYPLASFGDIYSRFRLTGSFTPTGRSRADVQRYIESNRNAQVLPGSVVHIPNEINLKIASGTAVKNDFNNLQNYQMTNLLDFLSSKNIPSELSRRIAATAAVKLKSKLPATGINENIWAKSIEKAEQSAIIEHADELLAYTNRAIYANRGGMIPGYAGGGGVLSKAGVLKKLGAMFSVNEGGRGYTVNALPRYVNTKAFDMLPISLKAKKFLYGALVDDITNRSPKSTGTVPYGPITSFGRMSKTIRGFGSKDRYDIWQNVSGMLKNNPNLSEHDRAFFAKVNSNSQEMPWFVARGLGFNRGGKIPGYVRGGGIARMLLPQLGYLGGSMLGQQIGGFPGSILGSILGGSLFSGGMGRGPIAFPGTTRKAFQTEDGMVGAGPLRASYEKSIFNQTQFGLSLARNTLQGGKFTATLSKMALGLTKTNLILAGVTAAAVAGYKVWQSYQEKLEMTRKSFGLTSESADKLGLKFKDYNSEIKNSLNTLSAIRERGRMTFESLASSGTPLNMTIEQYKKLKEQVKSTMAEQIKMIDVTRKGDLGQLAIQLKEQFVNAGMSAEEASKKIYAAFQLSNKAKFADVSTVGNVGFTGIINAQTSAISSMRTFGLAAASGDAVSQANALNTALGGVDRAISEIQKEWQKSNKTAKEGLTEYEAMKQLQDQINSKVKTQTTLSTELINELAKQNPEIRNFANQQDTVLSLWQKMRLAASGYTGDLSRAGAEQTNATYRLQQALLKIYTSANASGSLKKQNEELKNYKSQAEKLEKAVKGQSAQQQQSAQDRIQELQKEIDLINKKADARKKALQEQQQDEDLITEIKKKQIEYQEMLASGNMAAAAAAQLDIQTLTGQQQRVLAERAIEQKREADIAPKQAEIEKIQDAQNKIGAAATKAAETLDKVSSKYDQLKEKIDGYNLAMANYATAIKEGQKDMSGVSKQLIDAAKALGMDVPYNAGSRGPSAITGKLASFADTAEETAKKFWEKVGANKININTAEVNINADKIKSESPVTKLNVTQGRPLPGGVMTPNTISAQDLAKEKIKVEVGTVFTDASGQKWKIVSKPNAYNQEVSVQKLGMGGMPKHYGPGGDVMGPGTSTSDSIPAMLSNGEYVIRAAAVKKYGKELFDGLNAQQFAKGGMLSPKYNIPTPSTTMVNPMPMGYNRGGVVHRYDVGGLVVNAAPGQNERQVAEYVVQMLEGKNILASAKSGDKGRYF